MGEKAAKVKKAHQNRPSKLVLTGILLLPAALLLNWAAGFNPALVEKLYSTGFNRIIVSSLSLATGLFPFSLGEFLALVLITALLIYMFIKIYHIKKGSVPRPHLPILGMRMLALVGLVYFLFILLWGLNYQRLAFAELAGLTVRPAEPAELSEVCQGLLKRAIELRCSLHQDPRGVMYLQQGKAGTLERAAAGYEAAASVYPQLGGRYGRPKGVLLSGYMSYLGISGVYNPLTGEANINMAFPDALVPATVCHEMAHQRGFAREDEANYIAYLTCNYNPDREYQYSGTLLALLHVMTALQSSSPEQYTELEKQVSPEIRADLSEYYAYWRRHEGRAAQISSRINDLFLKSNRQSDGNHSYNRMVALLLAEHRAKRMLPPLAF
ncbi:MAG: DUF3810 domain-containing protein [Syntrophomonas sp.]